MSLSGDHLPVRSGSEHAVRSETGGAESRVGRTTERSGWRNEMTAKDDRPRAPVTDAIVIAVARLVDDAQVGTREPSHSDIEFQVNRAGLSAGDPKAQGQAVGKAKRVRAVLTWALEQAPEGGEIF